MTNLIKNYISFKTSKLVFADWNYKEDEPQKLEKLKNNLKRNGQIENIIVRELETGFFEVVNGNHRLKAIMELGIEEVIAYNLGKISDSKAKRIAVETNETRFETNNIKLSELLKEISFDFDELDLVGTLPYTQQELQDLTNLLDYDFEQYNTEEEEDPKKTNTKAIFFTFEYSKFLELDAKLKNAKEKLACNTNEETLEKLLEKYN